MRSQNIVDQMVDDQINKLAPQFRPEFGNEDHINLSKAMASLDRKKTELAKLENVSKKARKLEKEIALDKRQVLYKLKGILNVV